MADKNAMNEQEDEFSDDGSVQDLIIGLDYTDFLVSADETTSSTEESGGREHSAEQSFEHKEPITELPYQYFNDLRDGYVDEFHLFLTFFEEIRKNLTLLKIIDDVTEEKEECELYTRTLKNPENLPTRPVLPLLKDYSPDLSFASKALHLETNPFTHVAAQREIHLGEVLIVEHPVLFLMPINCKCHGYRNFRCHYCGVVIFRFVPCEHCDVCLFCNHKCRITAWNEFHRWECYGLQRHFWSGDPHIYMAFRMMLLGMNSNYLMPHNSRCKLKPVLPDTIYRELNCMSIDLSEFDHNELSKLLLNVVRTVVYLIEKTDFFQWLVNYKCEATRVNACELYMRIGGILIRHYYYSCFHTLKVPVPDFFRKIGDEHDAVIGEVMTLTVSKIRHCCLFNAIVEVKGSTLVVRATRDIQPGEEIMICYYPVNPSMGNEYKRFMLGKRDLDCPCIFCKATYPVEDAWTCAQCRGMSFKVNKNEVFCLSCEGTFSVKKYYDALAAASEKFDLYNKTGCINDYVECVEMYKKVLFITNKVRKFLTENLYKELTQRRGCMMRGCAYAYEMIELQEQNFAPMDLNLAYVIFNILLFLVKHENLQFVDKKHYRTKTAFQLMWKKVELARKIFNFYYSEKDVLEYTSPLNEIKIIAGIK